MIFQNWRISLRYAVAICTAVTAIGGCVGAMAAYSDYAPATRGYVQEVTKERVDSALLVTTAQIGNLQRETAETRLQLNQLRLETLRNAKWNRTEQLKVATDLPTREMIRQQLEQIDDDLSDVKAERDRLHVSPP